MTDATTQQPKRRPDYNVSVLARSNEHKGRVGVAWANPDGTIGIQLNPFVVLSAAQDLVIRLFPCNHTEKVEEQLL